jgi:tubulin epsilon
MNNIAAHLLLNLTRFEVFRKLLSLSSMRFGGSLNIDLNEITMNLVPYPKMHFLLSSLTPIYSLGQSNVQPRT